MTLPYYPEKNENSDIENIKKEKYKNIKNINYKNEIGENNIDSDMDKIEKNNNTIKIIKSNEFIKKIHLILL